MTPCLELGLCQNRKPLCDDCIERPLRGLRGCEGEPALGQVLPILPVVRRPADPADPGTGAPAGAGAHAALQGGSDRLGCHGPRRACASLAGQRAHTTAAGRLFGARAAEEDETPLSAREAVYLLPTYGVRA